MFSIFQYKPPVTTEPQTSEDYIFKKGRNNPKNVGLHERWQKIISCFRCLNEKHIWCNKQHSNYSFVQNSVQSYSFQTWLAHFCAICFSDFFRIKKKEFSRFCALNNHKEKHNQTVRYGQNKNIHWLIVLCQNGLLSI